MDIVRRLTPTECERLQGFEDDWTKLDPIDDMSDEDVTFWNDVLYMQWCMKPLQYDEDGDAIPKKPFKPMSKESIIKWYNRMISADTPRYKALGNSLALPQWYWIAQKMEKHLPEGATLGSLFDGIGGFPCVWEEVYGKGTARWGSEIEPFCIAVTKVHFPEGE